MGMRRTLTLDSIKQCLLRVGWAGNGHYDLEIWGQIWIMRVLREQSWFAVCRGCAPPIIPPGGISCQRKYFRLAICILDFICKIVSRTSFILKNDFHFEIQGTSMIFILIFPQDYILILTSICLLELGTIRLEPIQHHLYTMNAGNILWARLDKSPALDYNSQKNLFSDNSKVQLESFK